MPYLKELVITLQKRFRCRISAISVVCVCVTVCPGFEFQCGWTRSLKLEHTCVILFRQTQFHARSQAKQELVVYLNGSYHISLGHYHSKMCAAKKTF